MRMEITREELDATAKEQKRLLDEASKRKPAAGSRLTKRIAEATDNIRQGLIVARRVRNTAWVDSMVRDLDWLSKQAEKSATVSLSNQGSAL